jgi:hypothetical protein
MKTEKLKLLFETLKKTEKLKLLYHAQGTSEFKYFIDDKLIYKTMDTGLQFPIPIKDLNGVHTNAVEKSILFIRWIRKHMEDVG